MLTYDKSPTTNTRDSGDLMSSPLGPLRIKKQKRYELEGRPSEVATENGEWPYLEDSRNPLPRWSTIHLPGSMVKTQ